MLSREGGIERVGHESVYVCVWRGGVRGCVEKMIMRGCAREWVERVQCCSTDCSQPCNESMAVWKKLLPLLPPPLLLLLLLLLLLPPLLLLLLLPPLLLLLLLVRLDIRSMGLPVWM